MRFNETISGDEPDQFDFVPRSRNAQIWGIIGVFGTTILLILLLGSISEIARGVSVMFFSMTLVALLCFYVVYRKQQSIDMLTSVEYQNLLFSQAMTLGNGFCLFVRRDGTVLYTDHGFDKRFTTLNRGSTDVLTELFTQNNVGKAEHERIMAAIHRGTSDRMVLSVRQGDGSTQDYILTVDPLPRPGGLCFIRGREYLSERAGTERLPEALRATSADRLNHLLTYSPVAHYTTDAHGMIEYANPAFEQLLGYTPGYVIEHRKTLRHVIAKLGGTPIAEDYTLSAHSGSATLRRADGAPISCTLSQQIMRDGDGKIIGATGSILAPESDA